MESKLNNDMTTKIKIKIFKKITKLKQTFVNILSRSCNGSVRSKKYIRYSSRFSKYSRYCLQKKKGINGNLKYNVKLLQETQKTETTRSRNYQLFFKELHSKMKAKKFTLSTSTYEGSFVVLKRLQHKQSTQCAPQILN